MEQCNGPLTYSQMHGLLKCIEKCKYIDDARQLLSTKKEYERIFDVCNYVILMLAQFYETDERTACHALMVAQIFISRRSIADHRKFSPTTPFKLFWVCVAMVCYSLSASFHETKWPKLKEMITITKIPHSSYAKKFYKRTQVHVLSLIEWKLYFPTGEIQFTIFS
jgi:hypothetical protein